MTRRRCIGTLRSGGAALAVLLAAAASPGQDPPSTRPEFQAPPVHSSWEDLLEGIANREQWLQRKAEIRARFLDLIRDRHKPPRPPLDLRIHERVDVDGVYTRRLISYGVEADERAHAYLAVPSGLAGPAPAVVVLHGTFEKGKDQAAGLVDDPDKAYLDHLARRGYVVIAPDHFVAGHRVPPEGAYNTTRFHQKHPEWTAIGKFTYEHSIAVDVLESLVEVDRSRIGVLGHSLGGQGSFYLAAYDPRIAAAVCNCAAPTFRANPRVLDWSRDRWYVYLKHLRPGLLEGRLPGIDVHHMVALIAPRPFLDLSGLNDGNPATQRQRVLMNVEIMRVYEMEARPANFAFYVHGRGHSVAYESRQLMYGWLDAHLKPPSLTQARLVGAADTRPSE